MTNRADMEALAALCLAAGLDMHEAGETELARINVPETLTKIRAKQAAKPTGSALPIAAPAVPQDVAGISDRLKRIQRDMLETVSGSTGWIDGSEARAFVRRIDAELQQLAALSQQPPPVAASDPLPCVVHYFVGGKCLHCEAPSTPSAAPQNGEG